MNYLEPYRRFLQEEKRVSVNTAVSYVRDVERYLDWLREETLTPERVRRADVERYTKYLLGQGKTLSTVTRSVSSLSSFYLFLKQRNVISSTPVKGVLQTKITRKFPQILTNEEIALFLEQPDIRYAKGIRDKAMLELLYATGIRVSELIALDLEHIDLGAGHLRCAGRKIERIIPMYPAAVQAMRRYVDHVRPLLVKRPDEQALFVNMNGSRMTRQGFWKLIKTYQEMAGIRKDITPHTLRHSFAAHLLANGADVRSVQALLGHADVSSTQIYTQLANQNNVYAKSHPRS